ADVSDMAEPGDPGFIIPGPRLRLGYRSGIGGVRRTSNQKLRIRYAPAQEAMCGNERADSFILKEPADKSECRRAHGLGEWREAVHIDARSGDQRNPVLGDAERH